MLAWIELDRGPRKAVADDLPTHLRMAHKVLLFMGLERFQQGRRPPGARQAPFSGARMGQVGPFPAVARGRGDGAGVEKFF
jgi:hypothetical protein